MNFLYTLILVMYMNFATDALGVAPGALGAIFFAARIWDAVSDPIAGRLSDRTLAQRGRRKTWLIASSLPLSKVATGIMLGLVGLVLEWVGFEAGTPPSDAARFGMLFLMGGVPLIGFAIGMAAFLRFSLTEAEHARIRREIEAQAGAPS